MSIENQICTASCWLALEDDCVCFCNGANHKKVNDRFLMQLAIQELQEEEKKTDFINLVRKKDEILRTIKKLALEELYSIENSIRDFFVRVFV